MKLFANITNEALAKLTSLEFLGGAMVSIFLVGGLWANINGSIAEAQSAAETNKDALVDVQSDLSAVKTDVALIRQSQADYQHAQEKAQEAQSEELAEQRADIKKIISILGTRAGD